MINLPMVSRLATVVAAVAMAVLEAATVVGATKGTIVAVEMTTTTTRTRSTTSATAMTMRRMELEGSILEIVQGTRLLSLAPSSRVITPTYADCVRICLPNQIVQTNELILISLDPFSRLWSIYNVLQS
jgi:hypothetical protein